MTQAKTKPPSDDGADEALKRLGGGRWQTRDERFTIEPQSSTWSVVDAAETDDFGLPLVRGPFKSLTEAKAAIGTARASEPAASPLAQRLEGREQATPGERAGPAAPGKRPAGAAPGKRPAGAAPVKPEVGGDRRPFPETTGRTSSPAATPPTQVLDEPGWLLALGPAERGRARRLIERLTADGTPDALGIVRRDLVGDVPALAAHAISRRLADLPQDVAAAAVVALLADGRDERLGVRWRLVDGDGRPIVIDAAPARGRGTGR